MLSPDVVASAPDRLGDALKVVQIAFYVVAAIVAVLTYRAAKKGWLAPVNTEYQKRVMDRLAKLAEDLYSEFDPLSEHHWAKIRVVHDEIKRLNDTFERHKEDLFTAGEWLFGTPVTEDVQRLEHILRPVVSDPFIPEKIREAVVDFLENRVAVLTRIYIDEFESYCDGLAKGTQEPLTDLDAVNAIHNRIVDAQREQGCGIGAIENEIHDLRGLIQSYFDEFSPRGGKTRRKKRHKPEPSPDAEAEVRVSDGAIAADATPSATDAEPSSEDVDPEEEGRAG